MLEKNGFLYKELEIENLKDTIECVVDVFPSADPLVKALEITKEEFYPFAEIICKFAISENLSYIAQNSITGDVVGFMIASDLFNESDEKIVLSYENLIKLSPILDLLEILEKQYMKNNNLNKGQNFHCFMIGVKEKYRNKNIAKNLLNLGLAKAKEKQFEYAIAEATGVISQHIFKNLGFQEFFSVSYKDYSYNKINVFNSIADSNHRCILMTKLLQENTGKLELM